MITRYNRKTVTVITDDGEQWNVAPRFLQKAVSERVGTKEQRGPLEISNADS